MKIDLQFNEKLNEKIVSNFSKLKVATFSIPLFLLSFIFLFLLFNNSLSVNKYIEIQKELFFFLNSKLSKIPLIIYNLTQIGNALIFFSFLTFFITYAPKIWESLISASIISEIFSSILKKIFSVPRPAVVFDENSFVIIGQKLIGSKSLPSGHCITIFTFLTILYFAFMPQKKEYKILWFISFVSSGLILAFTRVGVGVHYPLDVTIGCLVGYIAALIGIIISRKYKIWEWIGNKKYLPFFILLNLVAFIIILIKLTNENLAIFYFSLFSLIFTTYKIFSIYVKK